MDPIHTNPNLQRFDVPQTGKVRQKTSVCENIRLDVGGPLGNFETDGIDSVEKVQDQGWQNWECIITTNANNAHFVFERREKEHERSVSEGGARNGDNSNPVSNAVSSALSAKIQQEAERFSDIMDQPPFILEVKKKIKK